MQWLSRRRIVLAAATGLLLAAIAARYLGEAPSTANDSAKPADEIAEPAMLGERDASVDVLGADDSASDRPAMISTIDRLCSESPSALLGWFDAATPGAGQENFEETGERLENTAEKLSASDAAEHLQIAALLSSDEQQRVDLLNRALVQTPNDPFVLWQLVQTCSEQPDNSACQLPMRERQLVAIDGDNSETWMLLAANRYREGDEAGALEALQQAASAGESNIYWTEAIARAERSLAASTSQTFSERAVGAIGIAAARALPNYGHRVRMCEDRAAIDAAWAYACLAYGELAERQAKTELGQALARSIQRTALKEIGDDERLQASLDRDDLLRDKLKNYRGADNALLERLIFSSPAVFYDYLAAIDREGEAVAIDEARAAIKEWLAVESHADCVSAIESRL